MALSMIISLVIMVFFSSSVYASLITIEKDGKIIINILSYEDSLELEIPRREFLEVKEVADETPDSDNTCLWGRTARRGLDLSPSASDGNCAPRGVSRIAP